MLSEPTLETHEDGVEFVKSVFEALGGIVIPPRRPRSMPPYTLLTLGPDAFMMDLENKILEDWSDIKPIPTGTRRFDNPEWAAVLKRNVFPHHSDVDWHEYCEWVSNGGGDEWFVS